MLLGRRLRLNPLPLSLGRLRGLRLVSYRPEQVVVIFLFPADMFRGGRQIRLDRVIVVVIVDIVVPMPHRLGRRAYLLYRRLGGLGQGLWLRLNWRLRRRWSRLGLLWRGVIIIGDRHCRGDGPN